MLKRSLIACVLLALASTAAAAREPVIVKATPAAEKDQSRIVSDPARKPQKFTDFLASEAP